MSSFDSLRRKKMIKSPLYNYQTVPTSPRNINVIQSDTITIYWSLPYDDGGTAIQLYKVVIKDINANIVRNYTTSNTSIAVDVTLNNSYTVSIVATNRIGDSVANTNTFFANPPPYGSLLFLGDVSPNYLSYSGLIIGTQAFTFEGWFNATAFTSRNVLFGAEYASNPTRGLSIAILGGDTINIDLLGVSQTAYRFPSTPFSTGVWYHFALVRNGSFQETVFLNGVRCADADGGVQSDTADYLAPTRYIGAWKPDTNPVQNTFAGYLSNLRIVVGSTVYDPTQTTITVPTSPLTNITNTQLLLNTTSNTNFIKDSSVNNFTMTNVNGVSSSGLSPFI